MSFAYIQLRTVLERYLVEFLIGKYKIRGSIMIQNLRVETFWIIMEPPIFYFPDAIAIKIVSLWSTNSALLQGKFIESDPRYFPYKNFPAIDF